MKRLFSLSLTILLASCLNEKGVDAGKPSTFIRYYYGGNSDSAVSFAETADKGFIIVTNVTITASEATAARYKIKLIRTDEFGNILWQKLYPDFSSPSDSISYKASGFQILQNGGYVVAGEHIQRHNSQLMVMTTDAQGALAIPPKTFSNPEDAASSLVGKAVAVNAAGNYLVLSYAGTSKMLLTELKKDDLTPVWGPVPSQSWAKTYEAGATVLNNRLFLDDVGKVFWSGTVSKTNAVGIRIVKTAPNAQNTDFDLTLLNPNFDEEATDFCRFGFGYAVIGSTNQKQGQNTPQDRDILFKRLGQDGSILSSQSFPLGTSERPDTQNDTGNSISSTQDGGLILLASVNSVAIAGQGDNDYLLIKIDAFGNEVWRSSFGSRFKDQGVAVRQASDGNFVVLGTTSQGGRDITALMKTSSTGKIQ
jgi:hypothetical protein